MRRHAWGAGLCILLLLSGCEGRDHSNPFDPSNPDTGGTPPLLSARARNGSVSLAWDTGPLEGIRLLRIYRREGDGAPLLLTPEGIDPEVTTLVDSTVINGGDYAYRLELDLDSGARPTSAWDEATPGTAIAWFADSEGGGLGRLTADGRDLLGRIHEGLWYLDLAADPAGGGFWAAEYLEGSLERYRGDGAPVVRVAVPGARAVAVEPGGANVWVGSFTTGGLQRWSATGTVAWSDPDTGPIDALVSPQPGDVWAACATGEVRLYRDDALLFAIPGFQRPVAFALSGGNRIFVLDHEAREVRLFDYAGFPMGTSDPIFTSPTDIESDGAGGAWIADADRGGLVHIDGALVEIGTLPADGAIGVTWDDRDGLLWIAGDGRMRTYHPDGTLVSELRVGSRPIKVALYHEGGPH
jgi:hypothetical protein